MLRKKKLCAVELQAKEKCYMRMAFLVSPKSHYLDNYVLMTYIRVFLISP